MLAKLEMELCTQPQQLMQYEKAVILQSILMTQIPTGYAEGLHTSQLHPYSQAVVNREGKNIWSICTTSEEAYRNIVERLECDVFHDFVIEKDKLSVTVKNKELIKMPRKGLIEKYLFEDSERILKVEFVTPTTFKSQGEYVFYPDITLIYQSLMNKYEASSETETMRSAEVLEQLAANTKVIRYNLRSCYYHINNGKIPAFMGKLTFKISGAQTMVNFATMLFHFGEYSGVGIKAAMGMGKIIIEEGQRK